MKRNDVFKQIKTITQVLIKRGVVNHYNFPLEDTIKNQVVWEKFTDISFILKGEEYAELYNKCLEYNSYNFILLDGAIIQMMYKFEGRNLLEHRLLFFPNPNNIKYDDVDDYEEEFYGQKLFTEINNKDIVIFPIRFDYSSDDKKYIDTDHTYSHLSLGNYKNCRIPVSNTIEPKFFIDFILRNFYFTKFKEIKQYLDPIDSIVDNGNILSINEKNILHINLDRIRK